MWVLPHASCEMKCDYIEASLEKAKEILCVLCNFWNLFAKMSSDCAPWLYRDSDSSSAFCVFPIKISPFSVKRRIKR